MTVLIITQLSAELFVSNFLITCDHFDAPTSQPPF